MCRRKFTYFWKLWHHYILSTEVYTHTGAAHHSQSRWGWRSRHSISSEPTTFSKPSHNHIHKTVLLHSNYLDSLSSPFPSKNLNAFYACQSLVRVKMAARKVSAEFCLGDPAFCSCKSVGTNAPSITLVFELLKMPWGVWSLTVVWTTFKYQRSARVLTARVEKRTNQPLIRGMYHSRTKRRQDPKIALVKWPLH